MKKGMLGFIICALLFLIGNYLNLFQGEIFATQTEIQKAITLYRENHYEEAESTFKEIAQYGHNENIQISYVYLALIEIWKSNTDQSYRKSHINQAHSYLFKLLLLNSSFNLSHIDDATPILKDYFDYALEILIKLNKTEQKLADYNNEYKKSKSKNVIKNIINTLKDLKEIYGKLPQPFVEQIHRVDKAIEQKTSELNNMK